MAFASATSQNLILMAIQLIVFILLFGSSLRLEPVMGRRILGNMTDRIALLELKKQIDDPNGALRSWNDSIHFCSWVGVTCGRRHQRVTDLYLASYGLGGIISPSIGNLTFLHSLLIRNSSIHGEIPQEISKLFRLRSIAFEFNTLQGDVPTGLANCTRLREIYFSDNNLVGKIPAALTSLPKLEVISINDNGLTGEISASFGNISSLQAISLCGNGLHGKIPESLGQLTNLYYLSLCDNNLSSLFPFSVQQNLSSLEMISFAQNQLDGSLPRDIGLTLPNLQVLEIGTNLFSGSIPNSISNISTLEIIGLEGNSFVEPVPNNLGNLQFLQEFNIGGNQYGKGEANDLDFITSLVNCTHLTRLDLLLNHFVGPIPNIMVNLSTQLSILRLGENQISGTIPTGIANLINLTLLGMEKNFLEGEIPSGIGKLQKLQRLFLGGNRLSGHIPSSICNLSFLYELHLEFNNLSASIPSTIGTCQHLQDVTLHNNSLQGLIPKQLFRISSFSIQLDLSYNSLVGSQPIEIGNLKSLSTLDISKNKLSKEIPSSIGGCSSLEHLYMGGNFFEGTIPQSLTLLKGLQDLDLSHNKLSRQIPKGLEKLAALRSLNLSFNNLEGEVPTKGIFANASEILVIGNDKLCGGVAELRLPACTNYGSRKREKSHTFKVVLAIISVVFGCLLVSCFLTLYWRRKPKNKPTSTPLIGGQFSKISYKELFQATGGFSSDNFIGSGSFGSVYKGIINEDETIVAIKVLNLQNPRAYKSFMAECEALKNIRHRNLVKILTSCSSLDSSGKDFKALVYEFMPNGSLHDWLHLPMETHNHSRNLSLLQRLNIAIDVAFALEYLHYRCHAPIAHCDLKPSNILLDSDMIAHVSDFGLTRLLLEPENSSSHNQSSTTGIKGSIGYAAPVRGF
ncbi:probable LRR receptor-like serine/threonine-protein kinase At3g47570 isoform X2 [Macadamia integrifolia]|uniref:probable LRR receptor-like serine/threonine-protein kinase At3g47570 isoform X2 n=1 Tax=Macadamia integrifolia TaxID=60698 RepID=UPI001C4F8890|nr:probable LRR receptor-like serine/threonine-protein kinase At3g47570 isoform X2 [Macadamia integrifolia]